MPSSPGLSWAKFVESAIFPNNLCIPAVQFCTYEIDTEHQTLASTTLPLSDTAQTLDVNKSLPGPRIRTLGVVLNDSRWGSGDNIKLPSAAHDEARKACRSLSID